MHNRYGACQAHRPKASTHLHSLCHTGDGVACRLGTSLFGSRPTGAKKRLHLNMFQVPTYLSSPAGPSSQSVRKGYYNVVKYAPNFTRTMLTTDPPNAVGAVIFQDHNYYWLRLKQKGEKRPLMHVNPAGQVSLMQCNDDNDQLLREESTCVYFSTCLVFNSSLWVGSWRGVAGVYPMIEDLPHGYNVNRNATILQFRTSDKQVHNIRILQLSKEPPSGEHVGDGNSALLWDPRYAYYARPFKQQPDSDKIGTVSLFPPKSTPATAIRRRDSSNERKFIASTALTPKSSVSKLRENVVELRNMVPF